MVAVVHNVLFQVRHSAAAMIAVPKIATQMVCRILAVLLAVLNISAFMMIMPFYVVVVSALIISSPRIRGSHISTPPLEPKDYCEC